MIQEKKFKILYDVFECFPLQKSTFRFFEGKNIIDT